MNKVYCVNCGAGIDEKSEICPKCGKKANPSQQGFFRQFLINHTKDELKNKASDKIYDVLKNWLLSHLYGSILAISVIAVIIGSIASTAGNAGVTSVSERPEAVQSAMSGSTVTEVPVVTDSPVMEDTEIQEETNRLSSEDEAALKLQAERYETGVMSGDFDDNTGNMIYSQKDNSDYYFSQDGVHDSISAVANVVNALNNFNYDGDYSTSYGLRLKAIEPGIESDTGRQLSAQGYTVAEVEMELTARYTTEDVDIEDDELDTSNWTNITDPVLLRYVWVKDNGTWKIAEDRIIS